MKIFFTIILMFIGQMALANDFAATVGFRSNSGEHAPAGVSDNAKASIGVGVLGFFEMASQLQLRSGFLYNQRKYGYTSSSVDFDFDLAYVDIPVTAMYKFADYGGVFIGPVLSLLVSKDCKISGGTSCGYSKSPEALVIPVQFGVNFKFAPQWGAELYYEMISQELWTNGVKNSKTVGANLLYTFE